MLKENKDSLNENFLPLKVGNRQLKKSAGSKFYSTKVLTKTRQVINLTPLQSLLLNRLEITNSLKLKNKKPYLMPLPYRQAPLPITTDNHSFASQVLLVEDNFLAQKAAKMLFSTLDCQLDIATNGFQALSMCRQYHYDLILMDIGLSTGMDGYEVTHHQRNQKNDKIRHIPIIALTAHAGNENKQRCFEVGMNAVLTKPLTQDQALDLIRSFIPARRAIIIQNSIIVSQSDLPNNDEALFRLNQFALFDSTEVLKNYGSDSMLKEMLTLMLTDLPADLSQMQQAFIQKDYSLVKQIAHKIKWGAVYVGTIRMKYACQYVERYWKTSKRELFALLYQQAVTTIEETMNYLANRVQKQN